MRYVTRGAISGPDSRQQIRDFHADVACKEIEAILETYAVRVVSMVSLNARGSKTVLVIFEEE